jgi:adenylosuccinate synthase
LLDIDHGTYPYVTSSNVVAGQAAAGAGVGVRHIDYVLGITKVYCTRVGSGPYPSELFDEVGAGLAKRGHEFGSVTGRPRRCGWLDIPALKRAHLINGIDGLAMTKLDVLDGMDEIKVCVAYDTPKGRVDILPAGSEAVAECQAVYQSFPGWQDSTLGVKDFSALPANAQAYLRAVEQLAGIPIAMISTGAERADTILLETRLHATLS